MHLAVLLLSLSITVAHAEGWSWNDPTDWPRDYAECGGANQSPINIVTADARLAQPGYLKLWTPVRAATMVPVSMAHGNKVDLSARGIQLSGSGFWSHMTLLQVNFHTPAEHTINGVRYALEQQLVFAVSDSAERAAAGQTRQSLVVVGTLFEAVPDALLAASPSLVAAIAPVMAAVKAGASPDTEMAWTPQFDIQSRFYTYSGSLTTPPCSEVVDWHVATSATKVRQSDVAMIQEAIRKSAATTTPLGNSRPTQKLNGREVKVRTFFSSE